MVMLMSKNKIKQKSREKQESKLSDAYLEAELNVARMTDKRTEIDDIYFVVVKFVRFAALLIKNTSSLYLSIDALRDDDDDVTIIISITSSIYLQMMMLVVVSTFNNIIPSNMLLNIVFFW